LGGQHVGFTCGAFGLVVPSFYPLSGSTVTVRYKRPTRKPDAWDTLSSGVEIFGRTGGNSKSNDLHL
jgi:hypothetical protein